MCYGSGCQYEIASGKDWGECGKPRSKKCPDNYPEDESKDDSDLEK